MKASRALFSLDCSACKQKILAEGYTNCRPQPQPQMLQHGLVTLASAGMQQENEEEAAVNDMKNHMLVAPTSTVSSHSATESRAELEEEGSASTDMAVDTPDESSDEEQQVEMAIMGNGPALTVGDASPSSPGHTRHAHDKVVRAQKKIQKSTAGMTYTVLTQAEIVGFIKSKPARPSPAGTHELVMTQLLDHFDPTHIRRTGDKGNFKAELTTIMKSGAKAFCLPFDMLLWAPFAYVFGMADNRGVFAQLGSW